MTPPCRNHRDGRASSRSSRNSSASSTSAAATSAPEKVWSGAGFEPSAVGGASRAFCVVVATASMAMIAGCVSAWTADFESANPPDQTAAIVGTVNRYRPFDERSAESAWTPPWTSERFREDIAWLVVMLQSDDPAVRFLAIESLDRLVGERHGYDASAPWPERAVAIETWARVLHERGYVGGSPLPPAGLLPPAEGDDDA